MDIAVFAGLFFLGVFAMLILWCERVVTDKSCLFIAAGLVAGAMLLRGLCMGHETADYQTFLTKWVDYFRANGGWAALKNSVGNYNVPYLYFLALFSYSGIKDLYLIKLLSVFFDVLLAWAVMRIVYIFSKSRTAVLSAFLLTLLLPTVVLNGAYWGQCDSIYASLALWSVYFALRERPILSMAFIAASFAFKLQAVFIMPVFLVFIFAGKIKWRHLLFFPLFYVLYMLPALLAGRPFMDTILLYFNQAGTVGSALNYNSSSAFALLPSGADAALWSKLGIAAAFVFLGLIYALMYFRRRWISDSSLLLCSLLICIGVPFFLPHMHDRYFFIADVLSLALAVVWPYLSFVPVFVSFASLLGYHAYLKMRFFLPMRWGALALALVLCVLLLLLILPHGEKKDRLGKKEYM